MSPQLEEMSAFFTARVDDYDRHMLEEVNGCREGYERMARLVPSGAKDVLDLGCGTGLELDALFKIRDGFHVTGIDLTQAMLDALRKKPLITAGMRLGEGTGAVAAMPLLDMARAVYMDCYTFEEGGIEAYTPQGGEG